jgi:hypothetical protein
MYNTSNDSPFAKKGINNYIIHKAKQWDEEYFKDHHLFYEFFHGNTGRLGASHQTGCTALLVNLLLKMDEEE